MKKYEKTLKVPHTVVFFAQICFVSIDAVCVALHRHPQNNNSRVQFYILIMKKPIIFQISGYFINSKKQRERQIQFCSCIGNRITEIRNIRDMTGSQIPTKTHGTLHL